MSEKHTIWSDRFIDIDEWKDFLEEEYPDVEDDYEKYRLCCEMNAEYLEDEKANLDKELDGRIIVMADLGLWYGRRNGYKILDGSNLNDCLRFDDRCDDHEYFVESGELRGCGVHHDGTNYYVFRVLISADQMSDEDYDDIFYGNASNDQLMANSRSLAEDVCKVYGWDA